MPSGQKPPLKTEALFEIPFKREAVWPILSKTDWLNRSAGLPPIAYRIEPLTDGGTKVAARARFFGLPFEWEEKPFEWREPEFYRVERTFHTGPIQRIVGGFEFLEASGNTRIRTFSEIYPRNMIGRVLARFVLGPMTVSGMDKIIRHVTEFLRGTQGRCFPRLKASAVNPHAFTAGLQRLRELNADERLVGRLEQFLHKSSDAELARIRPFAVARQWGEDRSAVLHLFMLATRAGLLDLSWEILCPNCRSSRAPINNTLSDLKRTAHCEVCQIRYDAEFDKSVELKFTINPAIRPCDDQTFCLAGPGAKPHVIAQMLIPPKGTRPLDLSGRGHGLRIRSPQAENFLSADDLKSGSRILCSKNELRFEQNAKGDEGIHITNENGHPAIVLVERVDWGDEILTAAAATNLQEFRDLFARQVISPSEQIVVGQQIILFTDLRGSTAMYRGIGDAPAYALVRDHFQILRDAVQEHRGAVVKTIGDAVMAVFNDGNDALNAVRTMHREMTKIPAPENGVLKLKSGLHVGPCLAVNANERLDYFGTTVNLAARLVDCCEGGDLTLSNEFFARAEAQAFLRSHQLTASAAELRFRGFELPTRIWRIPMETEPIR